MLLPVARNEGMKGSAVAALPCCTVLLLHYPFVTTLELGGSLFRIIVFIIEYTTVSKNGSKMSSRGFLFCVFLRSIFDPFCVSSRSSTAYCLLLTPTHTKITALFLNTYGA